MDSGSKEAPMKQGQKDPIFSRSLCANENDLGWLRRSMGLSDPQRMAFFQRHLDMMLLLSVPGVKYVMVDFGEGKVGLSLDLLRRLGFQINFPEVFREKPSLMDKIVSFFGRFLSDKGRS